MLVSFGAPLFVFTGVLVALPFDVIAEKLTSSLR
jgi:hypothetical protein